MAFTIFSFLLYSHLFFSFHATPSRFTNSPLIRGSSISSDAIDDQIDADPVRSKYVRISRFQFSYAFKVNSGQKLIRLHFNPAPYRGFSKYKDLFNVQAGHFTLLGNFSASLTADALGVKNLVKEFYINVEENQPLKLKFSPSVSLLHKAYAFVNGIEIIDMHTSLYYTHDGHIGAELIGHKYRVFIDNNTTLQMVCQLQITDSFISQANGSGMIWSSATRKSNMMNNFAWKIPVDVGFGYLVRLHLSELQTNMVDMGFNVLIDGKIADMKPDSALYQYKDYVVMINGHEQEDFRDLTIALKSKNGINDGPLTGFEVLKLSNINNSLASPNPSPPSRSSLFSALQNLILPLAFHHGNAIASGAAVIIILSNIINYKRNKQPALIEGLCHRFSLAEIVSATENFSSASFIASGGFGTVYRGLIENGKRTVAIKRLASNSHQGADEFWTEVKALSKLRHANLVSLIGYCNERREMILVYEYMPLGTLGDNLYKNNAKTDKSLSWEQRLRICIGAGRGLDYLHTGTDHGGIHRDVKSSNILLDAKFKAKISDFGLAKIVETTQVHSHVNTKLKGTYGYMDPAYWRTRKLTKKSDVYSFGVVLFEVLSGRRAVSYQLDLITWAKSQIRDGHINQIVDPRLDRQISPNCLKAFVEISEKCLHDEPDKRPTMVQLVANLEYLLEKQVCGQSPGRTPPHIGETSYDNRQTELLVRETNRTLTFPQGTNLYFSLSAISRATKNFSHERILMSNDLYKIYAGQNSSFQNNVVIARFKCAEANIPGIRTELEKLSQLNHPNLASPVGYCCSNDEIFIVYNHTGHGTLVQCMTARPLPWYSRLRIGIDAARGLKFLHMGTWVKLIHRDINPGTILVDYQTRAKLVNFGSVLIHLNLRNGRELDEMPPDFKDSAQSSDKSDVYLLGLVLLVLLCGENARRNYSLDMYCLYLPNRIRDAIQEKALEQIIDQGLKQGIAGECLSKFLKVAFSCLENQQVDRPSTAKVVVDLEQAHSLQMEAYSLKGREREKAFNWDNVYQELSDFVKQ